MKQAGFAVEMTMPVNAACQCCHAVIVMDYVRLGCGVRCAHCLHDTVPEVPEGGVIPPSGYQLTYRDFCRLLEPGAETAAVQPLLTRWYGSAISSFDGRRVVLGRDSTPIDLLWLHLNIQNHPARQQELYQVAMSLWR